MGYSWIDGYAFPTLSRHHEYGWILEPNLSSPVPSLRSIKDHAASSVSDDAFAKRAERWPESTPDTKEAYFIRDVFDSGSPPVLSSPCSVI